MKQSNKSDKIDARRLAEFSRLNHLSPVYHGENCVWTLKESVRSHFMIRKDLGRILTREKGLYRRWGIRCAGKQVCGSPHCDKYRRVTLI